MAEKQKTIKNECNFCDDGEADFFVKPLNKVACTDCVNSNKTILATQEGHTDEDRLTDIIFPACFKYIIEDD